MAYLNIDSAGEVRLNHEQVGVITWARITAHYDVAGEWSNDAEDFCHCCVDEDEWDEMNHDLQTAQHRIARMKAAWGEVRDMLGLRA